MKVLHISDLHFDPTYTPGSSAQCDDIGMCCTNSSGSKLKNTVSIFCDVIALVLVCTLHLAMNCGIGASSTMSVTKLILIPFIDPEFTYFSGDPQQDERPAGYWGDYSCDLPEWTMRNILEHIRDEQVD